MFRLPVIFRFVYLLFLFFICMLFFFRLRINFVFVCRLTCLSHMRSISFRLHAYIFPSICERCFRLHAIMFSAACYLFLVCMLNIFRLCVNFLSPVSELLCVCMLIFFPSACATFCSYADEFFFFFYVWMRAVFPSTDVIFSRMSVNCLFFC